MADTHREAQRIQFDQHYSETREYWFTEDPMTQYLLGWRLQTAIQKLRTAAGARFPLDASILFLCAGAGEEASWCCDTFGFTNVTFSDLSSVAVEAGVSRDARLKGIQLDAESPDLSDNCFDIVIIQDGLHHLRNPVRGFTEMLRVAKVGVIFIESHDSLASNAFGTKWEVNGEAVNFCFRWSNSMVQQVTSSYLGNVAFRNLSFSYWHHNIACSKIGNAIGGGRRGKVLISLLKDLANCVLPRSGNQFSGIILKP